MAGAFFGANNMVINATDAPILTSPATMSFSQMFQWATLLVDNGWAMNTWDTSKVNTMANMFMNAKAFNQSLNTWNTSKVTTMVSMFNGATNFNGTIGNWNTSNVTAMNLMFYQASSFNQPIWNWNTNKVTTMRHMFAAYDPWVNMTFNQDISNWDVSNVTDMLSMFQKNPVFNQDISNWNVSKVTNMNCMLCYNKAFDQDISSWDVSNVIDMNWMLYATVFNQDIGNWNTSKVTNMGYMFWWGSSFNQDISNWDVSKVTNMAEMFSRGAAFNQDISNWNIWALTNATNMFLNSKLSLANYDALLDGWASQLVKLSVPFHGGDSQYCLGANSRNSILMGANMWNIQDWWKNCILDLTLSNTTVDENTLSVGTLSWTSILSWSSYSYTLTWWTGDVDNHLFTISGDQLLFISAPDFETPLDQWDGSENNTYSVRIQINDGNGSVFEKIFIITVLDRDEIAPIVTLQGDSSGMIIAWSSRIDPGASWIDDVDGSGMILLPTSGSVDRDTPWIYILEYTYIDAAGNPGNIVTRTVIVQQKSNWGGGWGWTTPKDICPDWDYTPTYYDGSCGTPPATGTVDDPVFNPSIGKTCFTPLNKKTIYQWNNVTQAFRIAHQMIYSYELTRWQGTVDYRPYDYLTREEAARFMVEFAQNVLCRKKTRIYANNFSDLDISNPTLTKFIRASYEYEIFNGDKTTDTTTTFRPKDLISNDELTAIMIRLVKNTIFNEPEWWDWANPYKTELNKYVQSSTLNDTGRGSIAEVIYDLYRNNQYELKSVWYVIQ